ncbi:hypothetical protein RB595_000572 [Gaeumannomyces hyphopodioides]
MDDPDAGSIRPPGKTDAASDAARPPQTKPNLNDASPNPESPRPQQAAVPTPAPAPATMTAGPEEEVEYDDFGLPIKKSLPAPAGHTDLPSDSPDAGEPSGRKWSVSVRTRSASRSSAKSTHSHRRMPSTTSLRGHTRSSSISHHQIDVPDSDSGEDEFDSAASRPISRVASVHNLQSVGEDSMTPAVPRLTPGIASVLTEDPAEMTPTAPAASRKLGGKEGGKGDQNGDTNAKESVVAGDKDKPKPHAVGRSRATSIASSVSRSRAASVASTRSFRHGRQASTTSAADPTQLSEFSHQALVTKKEEAETDDDGGWQEMPAYAAYDIYDDDNRLVAKEFNEAEDETEKYGYGGLGGAGKGYTKVLVDDDAESATSMDENTNYLFKGSGNNLQDEEDARDAVSQLQATKDLLTEGQRIAYVGLTRLEVSAMSKEFEDMARTKNSRKEIQLAAEALKMWSQKMMIRLYAHMEITTDEQIMIEQLSAHGVQPADLTPVLMANSRVSNPMAGETESRTSTRETTPAPDSLTPEGLGKGHSRSSSTSSIRAVNKGGNNKAGQPPDEEEAAAPPLPYEAHAVDDMPGVQMPSQMTDSAKIDIDLRWTVLCDLFLVLIADSVYDARSRTLLERVGKSLEISWLEICRFEKKVTDALEMQQQAEKENWNEDEHMDTRRKLALKRRYVMMGLATVGGGLVIGLSAGLLAPVIGAGLVAGFGAIGVSSGTGFLVGAGGTAIIATSAATSGSIIGVRAANRRTGSVKTFEYRPLHNNKRVNLIVTVSGWMTGKVDDVRLPFSTVDSAMGDIYSVLWEPEMLRSMGDTINILATEALTQGLQQVLASTFLTALMAALTVPVVLTKLSYLIDNPWAVSLDRAWSAGLILADSLIDRNLGTRPVTLVGYSLGSRVIFSCLLELARKGGLGLVQNVYLFGSPVVVKRDDYLRARSVVSGRFVNAYNRNDWILGYLFRLTNGGIRRVGGLAPIEEIPMLENMDVSEFVEGHMDYRAKMPRLLRECGWLVDSDEFTEIEDPDPENHGSRQRELINEIEEARKELENEGKSSKGGWLSFGRKKKGKKKEWEIYEDASKSAAGGGAVGGAGAAISRTEDKDGNNHGVLFDVDAIRAELAREAEVQKEKPDQLPGAKELPSTLPPIRLNVSPMAGDETPSGLTPMTARPVPSPAFPRSPRENLGETQSAEATTTYRSSYEARSPYEYKPSGSAAYGGNGVGGGYRSPSYHNAVPSIGGGGESLSFDDGFGDDGGDEIQMTFDTSFDEPPASASLFPPAAPPKDTYKAAPLETLVSPTGASVSSGVSPTTAVPGAGEAGGRAGSRPAITTSQTMPNIRQSNPWANLDDDFDDPDFGQEKEISMTFA